MLLDALILIGLYLSFYLLQFYWFLFSCCHCFLSFTFNVSSIYTFFLYVLIQNRTFDGRMVLLSLLKLNKTWKLTLTSFMTDVPKMTIHTANKTCVSFVIMSTFLRSYFHTEKDTPISKFTFSLKVGGFLSPLIAPFCLFTCSGVVLHDYKFACS